MSSADKRGSIIHKGRDKSPGNAGAFHYSRHKVLQLPSGIQCSGNAGEGAFRVRP